MKKLTIVEAALEALHLLGSAATIKQIYAKIMERQLYKFGAKDPVAVLRVQVERHCESTAWTSEAKIKLFLKNNNSEFTPLISRQPKVEDKTDTVDSLSLVKELANKLKKDTIARIVDHLYALDPEDFESFYKVGSKEWEKKRGYSGFPVKTVSYSNGKTEKTTEVKEIRKQDFASSLFNLPKNSRKKEQSLNKMKP